MNDKVMLVTGTRKGIGKNIVLYYSSLGYNVIGCSRNNVEYKCKNYQHFCLDICDEYEVKKMFSTIRRSHGKIDILINNAGIASMNHTLLMNNSKIVDIINLNLIAPIILEVLFSIAPTLKFN